MLRTKSNIFIDNETLIEYLLIIFEWKIYLKQPDRFLNSQILVQRIKIFVFFLDIYWNKFYQDFRPDSRAIVVRNGGSQATDGNIVDAAPARCNQPSPRCRSAFAGASSVLNIDRTEQNRPHFKKKGNLVKFSRRFAITGRKAWWIAFFLALASFAATQTKGDKGVLIRPTVCVDGANPSQHCAGSQP